jgi:hypothetical protein
LRRYIEKSIGDERLCCRRWWFGRRHFVFAVEQEATGASIEEIPLAVAAGLVAWSRVVSREHGGGKRVGSSAVVLNNDAALQTSRGHMHVTAIAARTRAAAKLSYKINK